MIPTWDEAGQKFDFFVQKCWSFSNSKYFRQNIMTLYYLCYFFISSIFNFFQIIMVSLFLALHDQHFMFKDSNVFEFTNFPFKTKYNNAVVYSVNSNYLLSRKKQEKIIDETILWFKSTVYLLTFSQNSWILKGVLCHWRSLISPEN